MHRIVVVVVPAVVEAGLGAAVVAHNAAEVDRTVVEADLQEAEVQVKENFFL